MRKKIQLFVASLVITLGLGGAILVPVDTYVAACQTAADCAQDGVDKAGGKGKTASAQEIIRTIVRVLLFLIGAVSVIMIIIGGFRYVVSQGDSGNVSAAKNTILYAVIGLLIAIFAWAAVDFIIQNVAK